MGDLFGPVSAERLVVRRDVRGDDEPRSHYQSLHQVLGTLSATTSSGAPPATGRSATRASRSRSRRGAAVPARPRARDHPGRRVGDDRGGRAPAGAGRSRRSSPTCTDRARSSPTASCPRRLVVDARRTSTARWPASSRRAACGCTSPASTSCATRDGRFRVLEDNLRTPSGISYVVENRRAMTHVFPELFASHRVRRVSDYPAAAARGAPRDGAAGRRRPVGRRAHAGRPQRGVLRALVPRPADGRRAGRGPRPRVPRRHVFMRTTRGEQRVDVVYRRIDDEFLDPLHFRPDSVLGCAGHPQRRARRQRHDRERARQRRRRRQGHLPVRARDDRVLPRRGADPRQRRDVPARGSRTSASGRSTASTSSCSSRSTARAATAS